MCGRYYIDHDAIQQIPPAVDDAGLWRELEPRDISPSQTALAVAGQNGRLVLVPMCWGFPRRDSGSLLINARAETALEKAMFRDSLLNHRCAIPAGGFYEWNRLREKVTFRKKDMPVLYLAGFYNVFQGIRRFVILTVAANASVAPVHDRMPLILAPSQLECWIYDDAFMRRALQTMPPLLDRQQDYEQQAFSFPIPEG